MSSDKRWVLSAIPEGTGHALDLGGGRGELHSPLKSRGYTYVNLDYRPCEGNRSVRGDATRLPFADSSFNLVVSSDSLEHFTDPQDVVREVRRILTPGGTFVIWVPFMHPFHSDDYFRYTPIGLRLLMDRAGLEFVRLESPLWIFSVSAQMVVVILRQLHLGFLERVVERIGYTLDRVFRRFRSPDAGFAAFYLVVAHRTDGPPAPVK